MQILITKAIWFNKGIKKFEGRVNEYLTDGWRIEDIYVEKKGFRIICYAVLTK